MSPQSHITVDHDSPPLVAQGCITAMNVSISIDNYELREGENEVIIGREGEDCNNPFSSDAISFERKDPCAELSGYRFERRNRFIVFTLTVKDVCQVSGAQSAAIGAAGIVAVCYAVMMK